MKPMETIYWLKAGFGIVAAVVCIGYNFLSETISTNVSLQYNVLMNGLAIAIIIYIVSYYVIKNRFMQQVEKPQKLLTMGIGIYFLTWIVFWILMFTVIASFYTSA